MNWFRHPSVLDAAVWSCAVLWAVALIVPWSPGAFVVRPADAAYTIFAHIGFAEGAPWGTSSLHTGGPWGFLRFPVYYAPTYPLLVAGNAFIAAAMALLIDGFVRSRFRRPGRLLFVMAAIAILATSDEAVWLLALLLTAASLPEVQRGSRWSLVPDHAGWPCRPCSRSRRVRWRRTRREPSCSWLGSWPWKSLRWSYGGAGRRLCARPSSPPSSS